MRTANAAKYKQARALVSNGTGIAEACRRVGLSVPTYYSQKRIAETVTDQAAHEPQAPSEATLEEQVISSNLSPKAKVKILSTLLNA